MPHEDAWLVVTSHGAAVWVELDDTLAIGLSLVLASGDGARVTLSWEEAQRVATKLMAATHAIHRAGVARG